MQEYLKIENLTAGYGDAVILKNLSVSVPRGSILAVVGESGSGKSTLLKTLADAERFHMRCSGSITLGGAPLVPPSKGRGTYIGMVPQNPAGYFNPGVRIERQVRETMKSNGLSYSRAELIEVLETLKLPDAARIPDCCPCELSGGMNQRLVIAMAMLLRPGLLLCDEPTGALDVTSRGAVERTLTRLRRQTAVTIILVTHDIPLAKRLADAVAVLQNGEIVEYGPPDQVLAEPAHPYTRKLLSCVQEIRSEFGPDSETEEGPVLLETEDLGLKFISRGREVQALNEVCTHVHKGEILGVVGESGSGKSTLLKVIAGLKKPDSGSLLVDGQNCTGAGPKQMGRMVQMVFQNAAASFDPLQTVGKSILETVKKLRKGEDYTQIIKEIIQEVGLNDEMLNCYPSQLSGGQCQRMAIARAFAAQPRLLLCDECTGALDAVTQQQIAGLLRRLCRQHGITAVFVSHDLGLVSNLCDTIAVMHNGILVEQGTAREMIIEPMHTYSRQFLASSRG